MNSEAGVSIDLAEQVRTLPESDPAFATLAEFNGLMVGVTRIRDETPWERHPDGDEFLNILEGKVEVTVLPADSEKAPHHETLSAGCVFLVPKGLWHRQKPLPQVTLQFMTAADSTTHSVEIDPRRTGRAQE